MGFYFVIFCHQLLDYYLHVTFDPLPAAIESAFLSSPVRVIFLVEMVRFFFILIAA